MYSSFVTGVLGLFECGVAQRLGVLVYECSSFVSFVLSVTVSLWPFGCGQWCSWCYHCDLCPGYGLVAQLHSFDCVV